MTTFALDRCVIGDCRETLRTIPDGTFHACVTSPPYFGLRDYGHPDQIGLEETPEKYVETLVAVFREVRRVLRDDGTLWLNLGDSYAGSGRGGYVGGASTLEGSVQGQDQSRIARGSQKAAGMHESARGAGAIGRAWVPPPPGLKLKDLIGIPWRVAFALQTDGWWLRSDIIWHKPNPMPESVLDRPTRSHEYVFLLSKSEHYFYDAAAIAEPATYGDHHRNGVPGTVVQAPGQVKQAGISRLRSAGTDKQRGHSRRHHGFNARWDAMKKSEQCNGTRNARDVWRIGTKGFGGAHFAVMPPDLAARCILAGCQMGGGVIDPFMGSGTVGEVAESLGRHWFGCEINESYGALIAKRTSQSGLKFASGEVGR